ncbi:MAG: AAA family ATPase, partial [Caldilineaceae bacterium]|nr:AAA family ATPase [Caldilineaceae bacterium]
MAREGFYFVDRTPYIAELEQLAEPYLFFLRPRRFGKSLFISMLQCYYGLEYAEDFAELFGKYAIGQQPTPKANRYLVLKLDFSQINTRTPESTFNGFLENVKQGVSLFLGTYRDFYTDEDADYIFAAEEPSIVISRLFARTKIHQANDRFEQQIYVLIDEYDHFANELVAFRIEEFKASVSRNGYVRKFYEAIKTATGNAVVDRIFITGVSPLTLDSLTSGFNIGKHLSLDLQFHNMMGFTEQEVLTILTGVGAAEAELSTIISDIRQWYNGYLFNGKAQT